MFDKSISKWFGRNWNMVVLSGVIFVALSAFIWWLDGNFGPRVAVMMLGLLGGTSFTFAGMARAQKEN